MTTKAMAEPRNFTVTEDDDGIRLDRWFKRNLPEASFNIVSRWARTGQLRLDGKRAAPGDRIEAGQQIRVPPPEAAPARTTRPQRKVEQLTPEETELVREMVIYSDPHAFVLAKPPGLATQGGTKTHHHLDRLLDGLADDAGARPKLVHRLDKDTSGALLVARSARETTFRKMHEAEQHSDERRYRRRAPQIRRGGLEITPAFLAAQILEHEQRNDHSDRQVQNEDVETAQEIHEVHVSRTL